MTDHTKPFDGTSHIAIMRRPIGAPRIHMDEYAASAARGGASLPDSFASPDQAARYLAARRKRKKKNPMSADDADDETDSTDDVSADQGAPGDDELSDQDNADPDPGPAPGEDMDGDPADDELPPIARPRSWAKDEQADWDALPRAMQEKIAAREQARDQAIRKGHNDIASQHKSLMAKEQAAEQARHHCAEKVTAALRVLEREQSAQFPDVRSIADVNRLAETDPLRWMQWRSHQDELAWASTEASHAEQAAARQRADDWNKFRSDQNQRVVEHIPELGDRDKAPVLMRKAVEVLSDIGFSPEDLAGLDKGGRLSLFDHRVQRLIFDAMRYRDIQSAKKAAVNKPVPTVQRPGAKQVSGGAPERMQTLNSKLSQSGSLKDAVALHIARRTTRR